MTTLCQAPGACSLTPLIALHVAGLPHDTQKVDLRQHKLPDGSDYYAVNPKGSVPALRLDSGDLLTENGTLLQYIAEKAPNSGLIPANGLGRYRQLELLNYIATEVHKGSAPCLTLRPCPTRGSWRSTT